MPVAAAAGRDLAAHEDLGAGPDLEDGRALQRRRRARGYAVDELEMDPFFQLHDWKPGVRRPDAELGRAVKDQQLLGDMVRPGAPVEHTLDAAQHLDYGPVLVAAGLVLCLAARRAPRNGRSRPS